MSEKNGNGAAVPTPEAKVKSVKIKQRMKGLVLHVEGDPKLCVQALREMLELLDPKKGVL